MRFKSLVILLILVLAQVKISYAAEEPFTVSLKGGDVAPGQSLSVTDVMIRNSSTLNWQYLKSVDNIISFEIDYYAPAFLYDKDFSCTVKLTIEAFQKNDTTQLISGWPKQIELTVNYTKVEKNRYRGIATYKFKDVHKFKVTVDEISSAALGSPVPAIFMLKGTTIVTDRKYSLQSLNGNTGFEYIGDSNRLKLNWRPEDFPGAEMYDLEYTFVDLHSVSGQRLINNFASGINYSVPVDTLAKWFKNNSSRVTLSETNYDLNVAYDSGFILFRVRGVQISAPPDDMIRLTTNWNYNAERSGSSTLVSSVVSILGHEPDLNWQYNASFAEEGKRKEVISYFDGSMRSRQAVTVNNSDKKSVVQEGVFDDIGRPVVNILPAPANDDRLQYFRSFNKNQQGNAFSFSDIIYNNCGISIDSLSSVSGTAQYYSTRNPFTSFIHRNYIPNAGGYPLAVTEYTPDNTGRIKRQGGVGSVFQLNQGHETKYFYGKPTQTELDRLFGSEAGDFNHYLKNMVVDPNGQVSVSYIDASGKTIASALAGKAPENLDSLLSNNQSAVTTLTSKLIGPDNFSKDAGRNLLAATAGFLAPVPGTYQFNYNIDPKRLEIVHGISNEYTICNTCYYDLEIIVSDGCQTELKRITQSAGFVFDTACTPLPSSINGNFSIEIASIGDYYISYNLIVSREALEVYDSIHLQKNSNLKKLNAFFREELSQADFTGCYSNCQTCDEELGEKANYNDFIHSLYDRDSIPWEAVDSIFVNQLYDSLYANCQYLKTLPGCVSSVCDERLDLLKMDVTPGGQYALVDTIIVQTINQDGEQVSSLQYAIKYDGSNVLSHYLNTQFTDSEGQPDSVLNDAGIWVSPSQLTADEFIRNFKNTWADSLVKFHPEYCYYLWCMANPGSYEFDDYLQDFDDADSATRRGFYNRQDFDALVDFDPFFSNVYGLPLKQQMKDSLRLFSRTLLKQSTPDKNILEFIDIMLYCKNQSNPFDGCALPDDVCRSPYQEWMIYRNNYLNLKQKFYEQARRTSNNMAFANCTNCYIGDDIFPGVNSSLACDSFSKLINDFKIYRAQINDSLETDNCETSFTDFYNQHNGTSRSFYQIDSLYKLICGKKLLNLCSDPYQSFTDSTTCNYQCAPGVYTPYDRSNISYYIQYGNRDSIPVNVPAGYTNCLFYNLFEIKTAVNSSCRFFNVWVCTLDSLAGSDCLSPSGLQIINKSASTLQVSWNSNGGVNFEWKIYKLSDLNNVIQSGNTSATNLTIQNLLADTEYRIEIRNVCNSTESEWVKINCSTKKLPVTITLSCSDNGCTEQGAVSLSFNFQEPTQSSITLYFGELVTINNVQRGVGMELFTLPPNAIANTYYQDPNVPFKVIIPSGVTTYTATGLIWQRGLENNARGWICQPCDFPITDVFLKVHEPDNSKIDFTLTNSNISFHNLSLVTDNGVSCEQIPSTSGSNNLTESYPSSCNDNPLRQYYQNKLRRYPDYVNTDGLNDFVLSNNPAEQSNENHAAIINECYSFCVAQADGWIATLSGCNANETNLASLKQAFIEICQAGCSPEAVFGASSAPAGSAVYNNFEDAIAGILGAGAINDQCTAELLAFPYPHDKQPALNNRVVYEINYDICSKISSYQSKYQSSEFLGSLHAYLKTILPIDYVIDSIELDYLLRSCTSCNGLVGEPVLLPIAFEPGSRPCLSCADLEPAYQDFQIKYNINESNSNYSILLTNYLNHRFGFALTFADYKNFLDSCNANSSYTGILCNQPMHPEYEDNGFENNCVVELFTNALENAYLVYNSYIDSVRKDFREAYMTRCLNVDASLNMTADLYEYHYTLYYYDQSGNLIKTVPPEGVALLNAAQVDSVQQYRKLFMDGCYQYSDYLTFNPNATNPGSVTLESSNNLTPYFSSGKAHTIEFWMKPAAYTDQGIFSHSFHEENIDTVYAGLSLSMVEQKFRFYSYGMYSGVADPGAPEIQLETANIIGLLKLNQWNHIAITLKPACLQSVAIYINGQQPASIFVKDTPKELVVAETTGGYSIGKAYNWNTTQPGWQPIELSATNLGIKQFRLYGRTLTVNEIRQNAFSICLLPASQMALVSWLPFNRVNDIQDLQRPGTFSITQDVVAGSDIKEVFPAHRLPTNYVYNSLNQVIRQHTPDAGESKFWYDRLGRLVVSQNAEQKSSTNSGSSNRYSYTLYDALGRITQVGEKINGSDIANTQTKDPGSFGLWLNTGSNTQVTKTIYDEPVNLSIQSISNSRKRVTASVFLQSATDAEGDSTIYSYDIQGNVKTLQQHVKLLVSADPANGKKRIDYNYDLVSGKVNMVSYQPSKGDQFFYKYSYDAENRLVAALSSRDKLFWTEDASYEYYLHGPLARMELGHHKVQGVDYAYTLQGWLKGINGHQLNAQNEMGKDGYNPAGLSLLSKDVYAYTLGYYNSDYKHIGEAAGTNAFNLSYQVPELAARQTGTQLFNGNISHITNALSKIDNGETKGYSYRYDQLNRLTQMQFHNLATGITNWNNSSIIEAYKESVAYDANGNILNYLRNGNGDVLQMDSLTYKYNRDGNGMVVNNKLTQVRDQVAAENYAVDIDDQQTINYTYDKIGNLVADDAENISDIQWTIYGKIKNITKTTGLGIGYGYDAGGNRTTKVLTGLEDTDKTYYIRDAQGNVLAVYQQKNTDVIKWREQHLYGSSRLGMWQWDTIVPATPPVVINTPLYDSMLAGSTTYELSNHLGNVLSTISDKKIGVVANGQVNHYIAAVLSQNDYYPFGMMMPGRSYHSQNTTSQTTTTITPAPGGGTAAQSLKLYEHKFEDIPNGPVYTGNPTTLSTYLTNNGWTNSQNVWYSSNGATGKALELKSSAPAQSTIILTLNVQSGYQLNLSSFSFACKSNNFGYKRWDLSVNNVAVNGGAVNTGNGASFGSTGSVALSQTTGLTGIVTVTITLSQASGNGAFKLDDFVLNGYIEAVTTTQTNIASDEKNYRYGFNGKENDNDISGEGNNLDFGARIYDSRLGRWLSLDPLMKKYPGESPYIFSGDNPIFYKDIDGRDRIVTILILYKDGSQNLIQSTDESYFKYSSSKYGAYFRKENHNINVIIDMSAKPDKKIQIEENYSNTQYIGAGEYFKNSKFVKKAGGMFDKFFGEGDNSSKTKYGYRFYGNGKSMEWQSGLSNAANGDEGRNIAKLLSMFENMGNIAGVYDPTDIKQYINNEKMKRILEISDNIKDAFSTLNDALELKETSSKKGPDVEIIIRKERIFKSQTNTPVRHAGNERDTIKKYEYINKPKSKNKK